MPNGVPVDPNIVLRALLGTMMSLMNQNVQVIKCREEISTVANDLKDLEIELGETKLKLLRLEYDFTELEN